MIKRLGDSFIRYIDEHARMEPEVVLVIVLCLFILGGLFLKRSDDKI